MGDNPFDTDDAATTAVAEKPAAATKARTGSSRPAKGDGFDSADEDGGVKPGKAGDPFSAPAGISDVKITEFLGELLLVKPTEVIEEMDTEIGTAKDVVRADFVVLTGDAEGKQVEDALVFQVALKRALLKVLDGANPYLLGRLGLGNKKKGKNAPFIFEKPDDDDMDVARAWLAANTKL